MASSSTASATAPAAGARCPAFVVEAALEGGQGRHRRGGHKPRTQRVPRLVEIVCDHLEQRLVDASHHAAWSWPGRRPPGADACADAPRPPRRSARRESRRSSAAARRGSSRVIASPNKWETVLRGHLPLLSARWSWLL